MRRMELTEPRLTPETKTAWPVIGALVFSVALVGGCTVLVLPMWLAEDGLALQAARAEAAVVGLFVLILVAVTWRIRERRWHSGIALWIDTCGGLVMLGILTGWFLILRLLYGHPGPDLGVFGALLPLTVILALSPAELDPRTRWQMITLHLATFAGASLFACALLWHYGGPQSRALIERDKVGVFVLAGVLVCLMASIRIGQWVDKRRARRPRPLPAGARL